MPQEGPVADALEDGDGARALVGHDHAIVKSDPVKGTMAVYCFANGELIGVECVNRPADFMAARRVLGARAIVRVSDVEKPDFELKAFMA